MTNLKTDKKIDNHLRVVNSGENNTSLELASQGNGARINGDFEVTGRYKGNLDIEGVANITSSADISLDSGAGLFSMKNNGTEFSPTNCSYAGMILAYTAIGNDSADASYSVTTSFVTIDSGMKVTFIAPPSGNVEVFISIFCKWTTNRYLQLGLSDNETYNAVDVTHEHYVAEGDETDHYQINHRWVITGLTAGTVYRYWLGAKAEQASRVTLHWGGNASGEYAPMIMKAIAIPSTIHIG